MLLEKCFYIRDSGGDGSDGGDGDDGVGGAGGCAVPAAGGDGSDGSNGGDGDDGVGGAGGCAVPAAGADGQLYRITTLPHPDGNSQHAQHISKIEESQSLS